jgi:hypothetical protein
MKKPVTTMSCGCGFGTKIKLPAGYILDIETDIRRAKENEMPVDEHVTMELAELYVDMDKYSTGDRHEIERVLGESALEPDDYFDGIDNRIEQATAENKLLVEVTAELRRMYKYKNVYTRSMRKEIEIRLRTVGQMMKNMYGDKVSERVEKLSGQDRPEPADESVAVVEEEGEDEGKVPDNTPTTT